MKEKSSSPIESVWSYLHGELTGDERSAFEQDLQKDADLRRIFDDASRMDNLLREALPSLDQVETSDDDLVEQVLARWEGSQNSEEESFQKAVEEAGQCSTCSNWYGFLFHPAVGMAALAATAVILLSSVVLRNSDGIHWDDPVFVPLTLRGEESAEVLSLLSENIAIRCQKLLQSELESVLAERSSSVQKPLFVSLHLMELRNGAFSLSVQVRTREGETVGVWSGDYSGETAFINQVETSAEHMAETIESWIQAAKGGRP